MCLGLFETHQALWSDKLVSGFLPTFSTQITKLWASSQSRLDAGQPIPSTNWHLFHTRAQPSKSLLLTAAILHLLWTQRCCVLILTPSHATKISDRVWKSSGHLLKRHTHTHLILLGLKPISQTASMWSYVEPLKQIINEVNNPHFPRFLKLWPVCPFNLSTHPKITRRFVRLGISIP